MFNVPLLVLTETAVVRHYFTKHLSHLIHITIATRCNVSTKDGPATNLLSSFFPQSQNQNYQSLLKFRCDACNPLEEQWIPSNLSMVRVQEMYAQGSRTHGIKVGEFAANGIQFRLTTK